MADIVTAREQVANTEAQAISVGITRAQFEHAIAVLTGRPPAELTIKPTPLGYKHSPALSCFESSGSLICSTRPISLVAKPKIIPG